jgi:coiled-coil domain-containing protein 12
MFTKEKILKLRRDSPRYHKDVFNIAPKRPNWDLKRDMEKKLSKLERKTQEAIHTLISSYSVTSDVRSLIICLVGQRLASQKGESDDLVGAMKAQEKSQNDAETLSDDEDD